jgi:phosphoribosyl 1,2-cyclic phosphate phosphodiesterase
MTEQDGPYHMWMPNCVEVRQRLVSSGAASTDSVFVLNHFSHNGGLNHDALCAAAEKEGFVVSYDGMEIEVPLQPQIS